MPLVNEYSVRLFGGKEGYNKIRARIRLSFDGGQRGAIYFLDPGADFPDDKQADNGMVLMHLPIALLPVTIDLLRNESPIELDFLVKSENGTLSTAAEPIGEEEV